MPLPMVPVYSGILARPRIPSAKVHFAPGSWSKPGHRKYTPKHTRRAAGTLTVILHIHPLTPTHPRTHPLKGTLTNPCEQEMTASSGGGRCCGPRRTSFICVRGANEGSREPVWRIGNKMRRNTSSMRESSEGQLHLLKPFRYRILVKPPSAQQVVHDRPIG
jgi:hypothetical protein